MVRISKFPNVPKHPERFPTQNKSVFYLHVCFIMVNSQLQTQVHIHGPTASRPTSQCWHDDQQFGVKACPDQFILATIERVRHRLMGNAATSRTTLYNDSSRKQCNYKTIQTVGRTNSCWRIMQAYHFRYQALTKYACREQWKTKLGHVQRMPKPCLKVEWYKVDSG